MSERRDARASAGARAGSAPGALALEVRGLEAGYGKIQVLWAST